MAVRGFHLVMQEGPTQGQKIELGIAEFVLGRDPACDFVINDIEVSRRHARLIAQSGGYVIEDLGSTNGTFVEGQRVDTVRPLKPGEKIQLGERVTLRYEAEAEPSEAETRTLDVPSLLRTPQWEELPEEPPASRRPKEAPAEPPVSAPPEVTPTRLAARGRQRPQRQRQRMDWARRLGKSKEAGRQDGEEMPIWRRPWFLVVAVVAILGACGLTAFLWYVDANFLWCDVFGDLLAGCRVP